MSVLNTFADTEPRLGRLPEVRHVTAMSRTTIYQKIRDGEFPAPVRISARAVAWRMEEVTDWVRSRPRATPAAGQ